jgi:pectate lyase
VALLAAAACGEQDAWVIVGSAVSASGGVVGSGGSSEAATGGVVEPTGGVTSTVSASGGTVDSGGTSDPATGAVGPTGGATTGGAAQQSGGVADTGGTPAAAGGTGGAPPPETGGAPAGTGGTPAVTGGAGGALPPETGGAPAGTGGSPSTGGQFEPNIDDLIGFAVGTTGGGDTPPVTATSCEELQAALEEPDVPTVVQIPEGTILDCPGEHAPAAVCEIPCPDGMSVEYVLASEDDPCAARGYAETTLPRTDLRIEVAWNKTLVGLGSGATLQNVWLYLKQSSNVIIRNLFIEEVNPQIIEEAGDGVTLEDSRDIWIDHCTFRTISDGFVDVLRATATLSWNRFEGIPDESCIGQHPFSIDVNDSQVTLHHNWFSDTGGSNPALDDASTFGHLFNNLWSGVSVGCLSVGNEAQAKLESNVFVNSVDPHVSTGGGQIEAISNLYDSTEGLRDSNATGLDGEVTYTYTADPVDRVEDTVTQYAGPTAELGL